MKKKDEPGSIAAIFMWIGIIAGASGGYEVSGGEGFGLVVGAIFLGAIGFGIGRFTEKVVAYVLFIGTVIFSLLINAAIRQFIVGIVRGILE